MLTKTYKMRIYSNIYLVIILFLNPLLCCECNKTNKHLNKNYKTRNLKPAEYDSKNILGKRQLDFEDDPESEFIDSSTNMGDIIYDSKMIIFNETSTVEDKVQATQSAVDKNILGMCPQFKNGAKFDLNNIADVWEIVYYQMNQNLTCFKIHLKTITREAQKYYESLYGTFSNRIQWDKCILQVKSGSHKNLVVKTHFLQGNTDDKGVMKNIIIIENNDYYTPTFTLRNENPDQWLLVQDLLLMRDCIDGNIVVFARVPFQPCREFILDALSQFGVDKPNGTFVCRNDDDNNNNKKKNTMFIEEDWIE